MNRIHWTIPALLALGACGNSDRQVGSITTDSAAVLSPSTDGVANDDRPTIRLSAVPNAARYRVNLFDSAGNLIEEKVSTEARVQFDRALFDGAAYTVRYTAEFPNGAAIARSEPSRFRVRVAPEWMPNFNVTTFGDPSMREGGFRLFNLFDLRPADVNQRVPAIVLVNPAGEAIWWYAADDKIGLISDSRVLPNGNLLVLMSFQTAAIQLSTFAREITWDGTVVWQSPEDPLIHHEVGLGPDGNVLGLTYEFQDGEPGIPYEGDGLILWDRNNNDVLWRWNIFDHMPPDQWPTPESANPGISTRGRDWSHGNAAVWDPARSLIWLSMRHFDNLVGVHYPSGRVEVILGKGGIGGDDLLRHQHAPEIQEDGSLLVYDNGNGRTPPHTRVVQIFFDDDYTEARTVFEWRDDPDFYDFAVGDADRLPNGNILVTAGVSTRLIEVHPATKEKVWELQLENPEKPDRFWIYRADYVNASQVPASVLPFGQ